MGAVGAEEEEGGEEDHTFAQDDAKPSELARELWPASLDAADMLLLGSGV